MNNLKKYTVRSFDDYSQDENGFWVKWHEAAKEIESLTAENEALREELDELKDTERVLMNARHMAAVKKARKKSRKRLREKRSEESREENSRA